MAQFWIDFDSDPRSDSELLNLFEIKWFGTGPPSGQSPQIVDDDGHRAVRHVRSGATHNYSAALFLPAGVVADAQVYVYGRIVTSASIRETGIAARVDAEASASTLYASTQRGSEGRAITKLVGTNTGMTVLGSTPFSVANAEGIHSMLLDVTGTSIRQKVWVGGRQDEPTEWQSSVVDEDLQAGYVALWVKGGGHVPAITARILAIGTDGDPAPTGPAGHGGSRRRSPLLLVPK